MGGKLSSQRQEKRSIPSPRAVPASWQENWKSFLTLHPGFQVEEVNWEQELSPQHPGEGYVRVVCISDTHCQAETMVEPVPDGDILIHAGDFSNYGKKEEVKRFNDWLGMLPHKHKLVIAGNHEITFDPRSFHNPYAKTKVFGSHYDPEDPEVAKFPDMAGMLTNCTYLEDTSVQVEGLTIHGSPHTPGIGHEWGFAYDGQEEAEEVWSSLPSNVDILVTHGPPLGLGDARANKARIGCPVLLEKVVERVKPRYHISGHVHQDYGVRRAAGMTFVNAATCDYMGNPSRKPICRSSQNRFPSSGNS